MALESIPIIHSDIIQRHILTRLDGPSLAATAVASKELNALATEENLWRDKCSVTWPSCDDPRVQHVISELPGGHRSFFSHAFPIFLGHAPPVQSLNSPPLIATELISAVDLFYGENLIYSKVSSLRSPFQVDIIDLKYSDQTMTREWSKDDVRELEENLTLSWILIDPTLKRVMNMSSRKPVWVKRQRWTGEMELRYATVLAGDKKTAAREMVEFAAAVTVSAKEGATVVVAEVSLQVEDMEGRSLNGRDSLVILERAMGGDRNMRKTTTVDWRRGRERYDEFMRKKSEMREKKKRREKVVDMVFKGLDMVCVLLGVAMFAMLIIILLMNYEHSDRLTPNCSNMTCVSRNQALL